MMTRLRSTVNSAFASCLRFWIGTTLLACPSEVVAARVSALTANPVVTVYVLPGRQPTEVQIRAQPVRRSDRILVRVLDPDERPLLWEYRELESPRATSSGGASPFTAADFTVQLSKAGLHEIRIVAGERSNTRVTLELPDDMAFGVCFQNGPFRTWIPTAHRLYASVPPHAERLLIKGGPLEIRDANGKLLVEQDSTASGTVGVVAGREGEIWEFRFPGRPAAEFRAAGFPVVLSPRRDWAARIGAGVERLPDGTVICHPFQRRIAALLPDLLGRANVGETAEIIVPLRKFRKEWLEAPERSLGFLGPYGVFAGIEETLNGQNLDPSSHWGGSLRGWASRISAPPPSNRWDRLCTLPGLHAGASDQYNAAAENLGRAALLDLPGNPYFGRKELLYRAAAAALRDLMALGEDEVWRGARSDLSDYPGPMAFALAYKTLPVFRIVAPHMAPEVRGVWTDGLRRLIDRFLPEYIVSARNQSAHFLQVFQDFSEGSGEARYEDMARQFAHRFVAAAHPSGYFAESGGPDGSYAGITHYHLGLYYRRTGDARVLEALRRSYHFFNHTVAPEPDGRMVGAFNFNHRIGVGFEVEQYRGARGLVSGSLGEVGAWAGSPRSPFEERSARQAASKRVNRWLDLPPKGLHSVYLARLDWPGGAPLRALFPCVETNRFTRDLGGELIAVRRRAYYATLYVGKPAPTAFYIRGRTRLRGALGCEERGQLEDADVKSISPFLGGGLSQFWTPEYGTAVLAGNWSPLVHHGIVATSAEKLRFWEDYFATTWQWEHEERRLVIRGRLESLPLRYVRTYNFDEDRLDVSLELVAEAPVDLAQLVENVPIAVGESKSQRIRVESRNAASRSAEATSVLLRDATGNGVEVVLGRPQSVNVEVKGMRYRSCSIGWLQVVLPSQMQPGEPVKLVYSMRPIRARRRRPRVRDADLMTVDAARAG